MDSKDNRTIDTDAFVKDALSKFKAQVEKDAAMPDKYPHDDGIRDDCGDELGGDTIPTTEDKPAENAA